MIPPANVNLSSPHLKTPRRQASATTTPAFASVRTDAIQVPSKPVLAAIPAILDHAPAKSQQPATQPVTDVVTQPTASQSTSPAQRAQAVKVRFGITWRPPIAGSENTSPGHVACMEKPVTSSQALDVVPARAAIEVGATSSIPANSQAAEVIRENIFTQPSGAAEPVSTGSIMFLRTKVRCQVNVTPSPFPESIVDFGMKLAQMGERIMASLSFIFKDGTVSKFDWQNMVAVGLDLPGMPLTISLTFNNGDAGDVTYTIKASLLERMKHLKDMLHTIHEIWSLDRFMAGREAEVMKRVEAAEISYLNDENEVVKLNLGASVTADDVNNMAENLGISKTAMTPKLRNIMRASIIRSALKNYNRVDDEAAATPKVNADADKPEGGNFTTAKEPAQIIVSCEDTATDVAVDDVASTLATTRIANTGVQMSQATHVDAVPKKESVSAPSPHERLTPEPSAKKEPIVPASVPHEVKDSGASIMDAPIPPTPHKMISSVSSKLDIVTSTPQEKTITASIEGEPITPTPREKLTLDVSVKKDERMLSPHERSSPALTIKKEEDTAGADSSMSPFVAVKAAEGTSFSVTDMAPEAVVKIEEVEDESTLTAADEASPTVSPTAAPVHDATEDTVLTPEEALTPIDNHVADVMITEELEEGEVVEHDEAIKIPSAQRQSAGSRVVKTLTETNRGRLVRRTVTVEEYEY